MDLQEPMYLFLSDIKDSTRLQEPERSAMLQALDKRLTELTQAYTPTLGLVRNYGDEIAGLFETPQNLYCIATAIRDVLYPVTTMRFVVNRGLIGFLSDDLSQVGGPIFKEANKMLEKTKKVRRFSMWATGDDQTDKNLNALTEISNIQLESMTAFQRQVYQQVKLGKPQKEIAATLGKKPQQVSDAVKRSAAESVIAAEQAIQANLENVHIS